MTNKIHNLQFRQWLAGQPRGIKAKVARACGVSWATVWNWSKGIYGISPGNRGIINDVAGKDIFQ